MSISRLDQVYRSVVLTKFFTHGWGDSKNLKRLIEFRKLLADRDVCQTLVDPNHPVFITGEKEDHGDYEVINGYLISPFADHLPDMVPKPVEKAHFQLLLPKLWQTPDKPLCLQMAGTGDHQFWRRRMLIARPLLRDYGVASLLLENPFYGSRKPKEQYRSCLRNVSDICIMGGSLILESIALLRWLEKEGFGPFCLHGISMGGHMASLAATSWGKPIALAPCLSWSTASGVFTQGVMSGAIDWEILGKQFFSDEFYNKEEFMKILSNDNDDAYRAGTNFANIFPRDLDFEKLNSNLVEPPPPITVQESKIVKTVAEHVVAEQVVIPAEKPKSIQELRALNLFYFNPKLALNFLQNYKDTNLGNWLFLAASKVFRVLPGDNMTLELPPSGARGKSSPVGSSSNSNPEKLGSPKIIIEPSKDTKRHQAQEALQFMRAFMDSVTHLKGFSRPIDPSLVIVVSARNDGYVPRCSDDELKNLWPGIDVRYVECGHVSAYIRHQTVFRKAIVDSLNLTRAKYNLDGTLKKKPTDQKKKSNEPQTETETQSS